MSTANRKQEGLETKRTTKNPASSECIAGFLKSGATDDTDDSTLDLITTCLIIRIKHLFLNQTSLKQHLNMLQH
jgi:hypothetical protein